MNLLQMSIAGAVMIMAVLVIRSVAAARLPKKTFPLLWYIVLVRLLIPFDLPSPASAFNLLPETLPFSASPSPSSGIVTTNGTPAAGLPAEELSPLNKLPAESASGSTVLSPPPAAPRIVLSLSGALSGNLLSILWFIGVVLCASFFLISYLRCKRTFDESFPVTCSFADDWQKRHPLRRKISIRQTSRIQAPLTYQLFRPVILLPKNTDWTDTGALGYVLEHEYVHIKRLDGAGKLLFSAAVCLHWFNPFVWIMYLLVNRDFELSCDESVIRSFGLDSRTAYAMTLIGMEEKKAVPFPFVNSFSKNAIEERIRAIMKMKRFSIAAVSAAAALVIGLTAFFATSAAQKKQPSPSVPDTCFTAEEYDMLAPLQFDGYEDMTVAEFQNKIWQLTDTEEYVALLDRFLQDEHLEAMRDTDETAFFLFNILSPLTSGNRNNTVFKGALPITDPNADSDPANFEYALFPRITDPKLLTVEEYTKARTGFTDELLAFAAAQSVDMLSDEASMNAALQAKIAELSSAWGNDALTFTIEYDYKPFDLLQNSIRSDYEKQLAPYLPLGLTYEFIRNASGEIDDVKMYYNGKEVRGIFDPKEIMWFTFHAGKSSYAEDAVELIAISENGAPTGLREATPEEQAYWDEVRTDTTRKYTENNKEPNERLERDLDSGSAEDYASLLELKTPDYRSLTVAQFNQSLLEWANDDYDRSERISADRAFQDISVSLTPDEKAFITLTAMVSGAENAELVRSEFLGRPRQDVILGEFDLVKELEENGIFKYCRMAYRFTYHIEDETTLTIGERDACVGGLINSVQDFWDKTDIDTLLTMKKDDIVTMLNKFAAAYSNETIFASVAGEDRIFFEQMTDISYKE